MKSSVRNHLQGTVREIIAGSAMCEVDIDTPAGIVSAVITMRSVQELGLKVGDTVTASMKSTNVFVEKG